MDSTTSEIYLSSIPDAEYFSSLDTNDLSSLHERSYLEYTPCFTCCSTFHNTLLNRHPLLAVPVCNPCKQFYTSQPWKRDSEDSYFDRCRSCAKDNHKLIQCQRPDCFNAFCNFCLEKNVGFIRNMPSWSCLTCDNSQILPARSKYFSIFNYWREKHDHSRSSDPVTRFFSLSKEAQSGYKDSILWEYEMWKKILVRETKPSFSQQQDMGRKLVDIYEKAAEKYSKIVNSLRAELQLSNQKEEIQESQVAPNHNSSIVAGSSNDEENAKDDALHSPKITNNQTPIKDNSKSSDDKRTESSSFRSSSAKPSSNLDVNSNARDQQKNNEATCELFETESKVVLETLKLSILRKIETQGFIKISEFINGPKKTKNPISSENAAIARLCNLNNLLGSSSPQKSSSPTVKSSSSRPKKLKMTLLDEGIEEIDLEDSDDSEEGEQIMRSSSFAPLSRNTFDSSSSSSSSDISCLSDEDEPHEAGKKVKKKVKKERESTPTSSDSKKTKSEPDFMTMSLNPKFSGSNESSSPKSSPKKRKRILEVRNSSDNSTSNSPHQSSVSGSGNESENTPSISSKDHSSKYRRRKKIKLSEKDIESPNKGRKNIHKIIKTSQLSETTKEAAELERERRKRIQERKELYQKEFSGSLKSTEALKQLILDFNEETKKPRLEVSHELVQHLKPHQADGVQFMWDSVFESSNEVLKSHVPGGAILAHCMGLGKTLQTITLIHTVLTNFPEHITRALVICPVNTVKNWKDEFDKWCKGSQSLDVHEISEEKSNENRVYRLSTWFRDGGVLIIGYGMYRNLTMSNKKLKSGQKEVFMNSLVDPGPDLVVCDEGHVLKNRKSALNIALNQIKTRRRIILTGTPLQNNLSEYFAMVDFVKPKLLGTYAEFKNRFANPIQNGQHSDSTDRDVRIMKKRSFILSDLLKGCLQRLDYGVLVPYLQPKYEYVLCINLTHLQKRLYKYYLENFAKAGYVGGEGKMEGGKRGGLFNDVTTLSQIWNHPVILLLSKERNDLKNMIEDEEVEEELVDEVSNKTSSDTTDDSSVDSDIEVVEVRNSKALLRSVKNENGGTLLGGIGDDATKTSGEWWSKLIEGEEALDNICHSSKVLILLEILKNAEILGDKTLVFSQSLLSLDMIEIFLETLNEYYLKKDMGAVPEPLRSFVGPWKLGKNYFRMDGSTSPGTRKMWCNYFNNTSNTSMKLFLISTKAGGLGINLVAANRVVIFDASWNPAHDLQSIFRVYRFGQDKPVYIYRLLAKGTMEEKIYDRQVTKQSLSARVVDEQQIERHFSVNELAELYEYKDQDESERPIPNVPTDGVLAEILTNHPDKIWKYHDHDSLLENQVDENLTEEERKAAWEEYENERKGVMKNVSLLPPGTSSTSSSNLLHDMDFLKIQSAYRRQNPNISNEDLLRLTRQYILQLKNVAENQAGFNSVTSPGGVFKSPTNSFQPQMVASSRVNQAVPWVHNSITSSPNFISIVGSPQTSHNLQPTTEVFIEENVPSSSH